MRASGFVLTLLTSSLVVNVPVGTAENDILVADFESDTYRDWKAEGEAFGPGPARGTLPNQMQVSGYEGDRLVNSFAGGDRTTGTLTSPAFQIERKFLNFLIGGGAHKDETCINLLIDGRTIRTAVGPNDRAGGSEMLDWTTWDVEEFRGQSATLQIVDRATGGWGHINVDQIVQSDRPAQTTPEERSRQLVLQHRYLLFPISNTAPACRIKLTVGDKLLQDFDIHLARQEVDWWGWLDLSAHQGQSATLTVDKLPGGSQGLALIESSAELRHLQPLYNERLRPQLRFSQQRGWNNDPNGMVFHDGEYHLFWQSNPFGPQWANMFWGHAVSRDLVHWEELPLALYPRTMAVDKCFSGSANIDTANTAGWKQGDAPVMVAAFTDTGCGEALALSRDRGRTWEYAAGNPIIKHQGRDPKLIWYEPGRHWVIAVYSENDGRQTVDFHKSSDLKTWERTSRLDGFFECPELFELPVDGDPNRKKWVIFAADAQYIVGEFNGREFIPDSPQKQRVHYGAYYASQCFSRQPEGRGIQVGWARLELPGMPFNQGFSLPTELTLQSTSGGIRLRAEPIRELQSLRGDPQTVSDRKLTAAEPLSLDPQAELFEIVLDATPGQARQLTIQFGANKLTYDFLAAKLDEMPLPLKDGRLHLRLIVDRPMYECVGGEGEVYKTAARSDGGDRIASIQLSTLGGDATIHALHLYPLQSIWKADQSR
jgi:fructan beta-fructosidase